MAEGTWVVIYLGHPDHLGDEALATRSGFPTREDAVGYAATIDPCWRPVVAKLEAP